MASTKNKKTQILTYYQSNHSLVHAPKKWRMSCVGTECSLHQLSPYIGKLKSSIAADLIEEYSEFGDLVVDPFSGSGTIPLEAMLRGRRVFASDISPYAKVLTCAKLSPPIDLNSALARAGKVLNRTERIKNPDLRKVPQWVRNFFHPNTLKEAIKFSRICREDSDNFLMACFLGILHHQRPGFLSYPSSHLVPYLRDKKYPSNIYPEMYQYRPIRPRIIAKIKRVFKCLPENYPLVSWDFHQEEIQNLSFPSKVDCVVTSPPYMNTLNYGRDNRLRLWFLDPLGKHKVDNPVTQSKKFYELAISSMIRQAAQSLKKKGYCILIVGERLAQLKNSSLSEMVVRIVYNHAPFFSLCKIIQDDIPDIRRARRDCRGTKTEHILIFRREQ